MKRKNCLSYIYLARLNAVFAYHAQSTPTEESRFNFVYERENCPGSTIQLLHVRNASPAACTFPPQPDTTQKFTHYNELLSDIPCYLAYRSEAYGPYELIFQRGDFTYLVLVKPASWTNKPWFFNIMKNFII